MAAITAVAARPTDEVPLWRLYLLRAVYLFIVVGLVFVVWPDMINPARQWTTLQGETRCMLAAFSLLCALGLRYPLQMIPVLLWEALWKTLWLAIVPLPQFLAGHLAESLQPAIFDCSFVVLVYIAVPWRYVFAHYVKAHGNRWR